MMCPDIIIYSIGDVLTWTCGLWPETEVLEMDVEWDYGHILDLKLGFASV